MHIVQVSQDYKKLSKERLDQSFWQGARALSGQTLLALERFDVHANSFARHRRTFGKRRAMSQT